MLRWQMYRLVDVGHADPPACERSLSLDDVPTPSILNRMDALTRSRLEEAKRRHALAWALSSVKDHIDALPLPNTPNFVTRAGPLVGMSLIFLADIARRAEMDGHRLTSTAHIETDRGIADLHALIVDCRNAVCHVTSGLHKVSAAVFTWSAIGPGGPPFFIGGRTFANPFDDDVAFYFGNLRLLLKRNLVEAYRQLSAVYGG